MSNFLVHLSPPENIEEGRKQRIDGYTSNTVQFIFQVTTGEGGTCNHHSWLMTVSLIKIVEKDESVQGHTSGWVCVPRQRALYVPEPRTTMTPCSLSTGPPAKYTQGCGDSHQLHLLAAAKQQPDLHHSLTPEVKYMKDKQEYCKPTHAQSKYS